MAERDSTTLLSRLERLYMAAPVGLCYLDTDFRYVHINDWLARLNGLSVEEHIGRTIGEVLPEVAAGVEAAFRRVIEKGKPILQGRVCAETPAHPGEKRHYIHNYYPDMTEDGTVIGIKCAVQDITDRVLIEEEVREARDELEERVRDRTAELRESEARTRLMADSLPVLISYVDREHRFRFNNLRYEEWFGRAKEEIEGMHMNDVLGSAAYEIVRPYVEGGPDSGPREARSLASSGG